jgi:hypothetical protein
MKLSLEKPPLKNWTLFANELADDKGFEPWRPLPFEGFEERRRFDAAVVREAKRLDISPFIFNQMRWEGTSGWEYWTDDHDRILEHAQAVAAALGVELNL